MFREACRNVSNEKDQNLIIDTDTKAPDMVIKLAPKGHDGSLPNDEFVDDPDGDGIMDPPGTPFDKDIIG